MSISTDHHEAPAGRTADGTQPVAVIGNGPVGQTAALLLARWHIPVILLDARPERELVGSKSICQQRDVLDIWESMGAGATIAREGVTWTTARTYYQDQELFSGTFEDAGVSPFPPFVNISQSRTEQILDERIAAQPLIDVRWGHRVTGIEQGSDGVRLTCATAAGDVELAVGYAVACPGAHGDDIRAMLGVTFDGHSFDDRFLICDIRADLPGAAQERRFYFDPPGNPGRQVLIHPCPDSTFRIDWQVPDDFDLAEEDRTGKLDQRIRSVIGDTDYTVVWRSVYRFHSRVASRMRVGRVLLAGDAAHLVAPFGARGLNSGVADAENAAWKIAFVRHGWAPEALLESYHAERHAAALENLDVTSATMRFLVPRNEQEWQERKNILEQARHDPAAAARVDSGRLSEPFWYVDSPLTTPDPRRPFAGRPPKGRLPRPAPGILVPDLPTPAGRLRELCRAGVTLLVGPRVDPECVRKPGLPAGVPVRVVTFDEVSPDLARVLQAEPDEVWVIRPDAYVAAVLAKPTADAVAAACARMLAYHPA